MLRSELAFTVAVKCTKHRCRVLILIELTMADLLPGQVETPASPSPRPFWALLFPLGPLWAFPGPPWALLGTSPRRRWALPWPSLAWALGP